MAVVDIVALHKIYGRVAAVDGASFSVAAGRVCGLLGRNGAGKTTLLRALVGLVRPTSGTALLWGKPYGADGTHAARVGVAIDGMTAVQGSTGRRELRIWADALGVGDRRVRAVLETVELGGAADRRVASYSTGMRQRLSLATALLAEPELLVLDEPTSGLDPEGIRWLRRLVREFAASGRTVLLSSHQLAEVERTVDDVAVLQQSVRFTGTLEELRAGRDLEERFFQLVDEGGREHAAADPS